MLLSTEHSEAYHLDHCSVHLIRSWSNPQCSDRSVPSSIDSTMLAMHFLQIHHVKE